jgi:predicted  nucleic acid-binding Zn-ribbon protein
MYKEKQDAIESQLKEVLSRYEGLKEERASDVLRIAQLIAEREDLGSRLAQSMDAKMCSDKNFQVHIKFLKSCM